MPLITTVPGFAIRLGIAALLGAVIGLEREISRHYAGIITNLIVCVGAYAFTSFSYLATDSNTDITRIAAQVVCGIGFLGAGVILSDGTKIKGINTAATIWAAAAVGILCCLDQIWYALCVSAILILAHLIFHPLSELIRKRHSYNKVRTANEEAYYTISVTCREDAANRIKAELIAHIHQTEGVLLHKLETVSQDDEGSVKVRAAISTKTRNNETVEEIITFIGAEKDIISTGWKNASPD